MSFFRNCDTAAENCTTFTAVRKAIPFPGKQTVYQKGNNIYYKRKQGYICERKTIK